MGQYHQLVNFTKKEFVNPHQFGNGLKLWEQVGWEHAFSNVTHMLIASCSGRGGGDFSVDGYCEKVVGRWGGDKIALVGDYAEFADFTLSEYEFKCMMADVWERDEPLSTVIKQSRDAYGRFASNQRQMNTRIKYRDISELVSQAYSELFEVRFTGSGWKDVEKIKNEEVKVAEPKGFHAFVHDSSLIAWFSWGPLDKALRVELVTNQGIAYVYEGVSAQVAYNFRDSVSKGKFFNTYIKSKYPSTQEQL